MASPAEAPETPRDVLEDLMERCRLDERTREGYVRRLSRAIWTELSIARRIAAGEDL